MQIHCHGCVESLISMAELFPSDCSPHGGSRCHLSRADTVTRGQKSPGYGWKRLLAEELPGADLRF